MLAKLAAFEDVILLVPRSGVQIVDLAFDPHSTGAKEFPIADAKTRVPDAENRIEWCSAHQKKAHESLDRLRLLEYDEATGDTFSNINGRREALPADYSVDVKTIIKVFSNRWLPATFFKPRDGSSDTGFHRGPIDWARFKIIDLDGAGIARDPSDLPFRLVLAFDTRPLPIRDNEAYLAPSDRDVTSGARFTLAHRQEHLQWFLAQSWVYEWLSDIYADFHARRSKVPLSVADIHEEMQGDHEPAALFLGLLTLLDRAKVFKSLAMRFLAPRPGDRPVDVDLVLDIGNSRTCGMIAEPSSGDGENLNNTYPLELRDLSEVQFTYSDPFESRLEFAEAVFGRSDLARRAGRPDSFSWPSIVRIGPEAVRLSGRRRGTEGNTGMSSPKRYLWDCDKQTSEWHLNTAVAGAGVEEPAAGLPFARRIDEVGEPSEIPAMTANYSRSSMMTFAVSEVLAQALTMINSPGLRIERGRGSYERRRVLRRVSLTVPTAMPLAERRIYRERVQHACDILWSVLGWKDSDPETPKPEIAMDWDEASCSQLVFLYNEVARKFGGDVAACFRTLQRPRPAQKASHVLRLASIDIGGGTTDMVITDYAAEGKGTQYIITPESRYREGFNLAGDDILLRIIEHHILPVVKEAVIAAGKDESAAESAIRTLFGSERGEKGIGRTRALRQQFALQVARPIGLKLLEAYEHYDLAKGGQVEVSFHSLFEGADAPSKAVASYIAETLRLPGFDISKLRIVADLAEIDQTVASEISRIVPALCELVQIYDCDVLLLSGRPSRLPAVCNMILSHLPLPPDRLVRLHGYLVGRWYPFRTEHERIKDPKTTVVVGAMLARLTHYHLPHFALRSEKIRVRSTAKFIGVIDGRGQLPRANVCLSNIDLDAEDAKQDVEAEPLTFSNRLALGFRQLDVERWPANPLYQLEVVGHDRPDDPRPLSSRTPLKVTFMLKGSLQRRTGREGVAEDFEIKRVEDREGARVPNERLRLRLKTLLTDDGYWFDTGVLKTM